MKIKCAYHLCNNEFEEKEGNKQATYIYAGCYSCNGTQKILL